MLEKPDIATPGAELPPLLLLPGTLCDERVFAPVTGRLGRRTVTVDIADAFSTAEMAHRIVRETPGRFALCGFSLGAIVALEVMAQAPERVERLALIGCNAGVLSAMQASARRDAVAQARRKGCRSYIAAVWEASVPYARRADAELRDLLNDMAESTPLDSFHEQIEMSINRTDRRPDLADIRVPTLVLCGAEDGVCPPEMSVDIASRITGSRLAVIENAGHYATLDQPDIVARELAAWLAASATAPFSKELL